LPTNHRPTGRRCKASWAITEHRERILLNVCEAFGIADYTGFGDPQRSTKQPLPDIAA